MVARRSQDQDGIVKSTLLFFQSCNDSDTGTHYTREPRKSKGCDERRATARVARQLPFASYRVRIEEAHPWPRASNVRVSSHAPIKSCHRFQHIQYWPKIT